MKPEDITPEEIAELLALKGWSQAQLARELHLSEAAVSRWRNEDRFPTGPARILIRLWLDQARKDTDKQPA